MIPVIVPPIEGENVQYCAGRRYRWEATNCDDADFVQWKPLGDLPPGVVWEDIIHTNEFGLVNYMTFPAPGEYCFEVVCGVIV